MQISEQSIPIETAASGNMENFFTYTTTQWDAVSHVLTLGFGVFAAALVYFLATVRHVQPRFRLSHILSAVVMVSAMLILIRQAVDWDMTFAATGQGTYAKQDGQLFSNGYRYMNWSIDVPVLLVQMLIVLPLAAKAKMSRAIQFIVAGLGMIWTSWAAQFAETGGIVEGTSATPFWVWYAVSWAFYVWIIAIVIKTVRDGNRKLPVKAKRVMNGILGLLLVSWTAYAVAIVLPQVWWSSGSGVARQFIFTSADIVSKAVYGVLLGWVATIRASAETSADDAYPDDLAVLTPTKGGIPEASSAHGKAPSSDQAGAATV